MKKIDMRIRPPYKSLLSMSLYTRPEQLEPLLTRNGCRYPESAVRQSMELLIKEMDENEIEMGIVPIRYSDGVSNDDLVELIKEYPGRFIGMAGLNPLEGVAASYQIIDDYVNHGPCSGVVMELAFLKEPMHSDDPRIFPIYEKCEREGIPVYLQWGGMLSPNMDFYNPKDIERVAVLYPRLTLILAHGGWPYVTQMSYLCFNHENIYLCPDAYMTSSTPGYEGYVTGARGMLRDRLCFSTAYPLARLDDTIEKYMEHGLPEEIMEDIFYNNAKRALGL